MARDAEADDERASRAFDRAWAESLLRRSAARMAADAEGAGDAARRRVELLRLRFTDGLPIREIAQQRGVEASTLHHDYAKARDEFCDALRAEVAFQHPDASTGEVDRECLALLELLG